MTSTSRYDYAETLARLTAAIEAAGNHVFAALDQSAAAASVGRTLRPTTLIVFGNPAAGTRLMEALPEFGLELPLKLLVWQDSESVRVAFADITATAARYGLPPDDAVVAAMHAALERLGASVV